jgi:hypothetical protein
MYVPIIASVCLASVIIVSVVLATYTSNIKKDFDTKMRSVVDQVNTSQFYQYELEKRSYDKLNTIDTNINNVRSKYVPKQDISDRVVTKFLDVNDTKQKGTLAVEGQIDFGSNIKMRGKDKALEVNLPLGTSMKVKDAAGKDIVGFEKHVVAPFAAFGSMQVGGVLVNADGRGLRVENGMLSANDVNVRGSVSANVTNASSANVMKALSVRGGASEHNPKRLPTVLPNEADGKNYVRGDTVAVGNVQTVGDVRVGRNMNVAGNLDSSLIRANRMKLGHTWGGSWWDQSPLTVYSAGVGASFGGQHFSHFPGSDGNTYIRPGKTNGSIKIGDVGNTAEIVLGDQNTVTKVGGDICVKDTCFTKDDLVKMKQTADNNLLQLQQALQDKLNSAQQQIQILAAQKATESVNAYKAEQVIREKSLQEQINQLNMEVANLKTRLKMVS